MQETGPQTIVKFLFTSGSTKSPKAVINTHGMWCAISAADAPVDAGAHRRAARAGGLAALESHFRRQPQLRPDDLQRRHALHRRRQAGAPALMGETLRNLREIAPTIYFNVPTGFEAIANAMKTDDTLRRNLLSRVRMFFYAGAALAPAGVGRVAREPGTRDRQSASSWARAWA
jgi:feruloyl-CoA synthase